MSETAINRSILVTGVSSGIGKATAEKFLHEKFLVFGSVRHADDASELQNKFPDQFVPLIFDVTDEKAIQQSVKVVEERLNGKGLGGLVNNAGIAKGGPLIYMDPELIKKHFDINVLGVIRVTQAFARLLGADENSTQKPGKIFNISSVSGVIANPFVGPYVGSKHALEGISGSLRRELMKFGIDVIIVGPGVIKTPIWGKSTDLSAYDQTPYRDSLNRFSKIVNEGIGKGLDPNEVANLIYKVYLKKHPKARYGIDPNKLRNWMVRYVLPTKLIDRIMAKKLGLKRE